MRKVWFAAALVVAASPALADYESKAVGNWIVTEQSDRFGDGGTHVAMTSAGGVSLAVRCIKKHLTLAVIGFPQALRARDEVKIKLRVDRGDVFEEFGDARGDQMIEIAVTDNAEVRDMTKGKEVALHVDVAGTSATYVFKTRGARQAFSDLVKVCPID